MIKEYCIIYEVTSLVYAQSATEPPMYYSSKIKEITIPARFLDQALKYAHEVLDIEDVKEVFEL